MINWNTEPYNDDYEEAKKFYRIIFRPGYAVQARELTQLQTILQNQISRHGDSIFKQGAMVVPGQISYDQDFAFVKLNSLFSTDTSGFVEGITVTGQTSGVTAQILKVVNDGSLAYPTLYIRYTNTGTDSGTKVFADGEVIQTPTFNQVESIDSGSTGVGSAVVINQGVYYINGNFVLVEPQSLILDAYTKTPSYRVGLNVVEKVVTPDDDETLLDNAQTSYNFAAPGAHRYYIELTLGKLTIDSVADAGFVELLRVEDGSIKSKVSKTEYSILEKTLARRTYDESGNFSVTDFPLDVREYRDNNRLAWTSGVQYLIGDIVTSNGNTYVAKNSGISQAIAPAHLSGLVFDGQGQTGAYWEFDKAPVYNRGIHAVLPAENLTTQLANEAQLSLGIEPGKAYIHGFEVEKIATDFITVPKSRDAVQVQEGVVPATVGNYVFVTNLNNLPPADTYGTVCIQTNITGYGGRGTTIESMEIGSARVRGIEWHSGAIGETSAIYKLFLFDVNILPGYDFNRDVKSFYMASVTPSNYATNFSADLAWSLPENQNQITGSASGTGTTITGNGTSFLTDLMIGDYILIGTNAPVRVTAITNQQTIRVDGSFASFTGLPIFRLSTQIKETGNSSLIFPFSNYAIKSVRDKDNVIRTMYSVYYATSGNTGNALSGQCILTLQTGSGTFASGSENDNYLFVDNTTGSVLVPLFSPVPSSDGKNLTATFAASASNHLIKAITTVNKSGSALTEKTKTSDIGTATYDTFVTATQSTLMLNKADAYKVISVLMDSGTFAAPTGQFTIDLSDSYIFDDGQRDSFYDVSRLVIKPSYAPPTGPIQITFEYFKHGDGDYFTANSYTDIDYKTIPKYLNAPLRDVIDFRPRMADGGEAGLTVTASNIKAGQYYTIVTTASNFMNLGAGSNTVGLTFTASRDGTLLDGSGLASLNDSAGFFGIGGSKGVAIGNANSLLPKRGIDVTCDFSYYLARIDKVALDITGQLFTISGVSSLNPGEPSDPSVGMVLYTITYEPYGFGTELKSVNAKKTDNKRYTMRDIGRLEKRITSLEYYTSLSLLEQETKSLGVIDTMGVDRFKNGFIVDDFSGHNTGDVNSPDYTCAIDIDNKELRPLCSMDNINLLESLTNNTDRRIANYMVYGDVITLPLDQNTPHVAMITQQYGSRLENVNPFAVFTFVGDISINPSSDDWFEVNRQPDVITNVEGDFTAISALVDKVGAMGTVWNAWQTQWTGKPVVTTSSSSWTWQDGGGSTWGTTATTQTTATQVGQSRTGMTTTVAAKITTNLQEDRILNSTVIPYMRSRNILIQAKKLKPNTIFYPSFDGVKITSYVTPSTVITFTKSVGTTANFDAESNAGGDASSPYRMISGDSQVCLNRGDIVTGQTSGARGICIGSSYNTVTGVRTVDVINVTGTFSNTETIIGSVSDAHGVVVSTAVGSTGGSLKTDASGDLNFLFKIPQTNSVRFRTGSRELQLTDSPTDGADFTSRARGKYSATGTLETKQATYISTRNAQLVQTQISENRTIVQTSQQSWASSQFYDPLAQTFLVQQPGGAFLTKVDLFFATKDPTIPVGIEIREVVNGFPGKNILPFSKVNLKPEMVNISTNMVSIDGVATPSYDTPTTFYFPSPIYVQPDTEYALTVVSDSNKYQVWISNLGDTIPGSSRTISEQPYNGVLFKSQNASTWTPNQLQDLMFTIYRAKFDIGTPLNPTIAAVTFVNDVLPYADLGTNPIQTAVGSTSVRINHTGHGMNVNSKVKFTNTDSTKYLGVTGSGSITTVTSGGTAKNVSGFSTDFVNQLQVGSVLYTAAGLYVGVIDTITNAYTATLVSNAAVAMSSGSYLYTTPVAGIPTSELYKTLTIVSTDIDAYVISVTTPATSSGLVGGDGNRATQNVQFDTLQPSIQMQTFPETVTSFSVKTASGQAVDGLQIPYVKEASYSPILINDSNNSPTPRVIASQVNEDQFVIGKSLKLVCSMQSTNDALSPMIDTHRASMIAVNNRLTNSTETNTNVAGLDSRTLVTASATISFMSSVTGVTMTNQGAGYILDPLVTITPAAGDVPLIAATAIAAYDISGQVNVIITNPGYGYTKAPSITIEAATDANPITATATATISCNSFASTGNAGNAFSTVGVGNYGEIVNSSITANNGSFLITKYQTVSNPDGSIVQGVVSTNKTFTPALAGTNSGQAGTITVNTRDRFVDEIAPFGSTNYSKYVSKRIDLASGSRNTMLKIKLAACLPTEADVDVYYKLSPAGFSGDFNSINYTKFAPDYTPTKTQIGTNIFSDIDYTLEGLIPFDAVKVKIVMRSTNTSAVPRVKDLRIIACE